VLERNHWKKVSESSSIASRRDTSLQKSALRRKMNKISRKKHIKRGSIKKGDTMKTFLRVQKRINKRKMKEKREALKGNTEVPEDTLIKTEMTQIVTTKVEQREDPGTEERENVDLPTLKREMEEVDAEIRRVQFEVETLEVELQKYLVQKQID